MSPPHHYRLISHQLTLSGGSPRNCRPGLLAVRVLPWPSEPQHPPRTRGRKRGRAMGQGKGFLPALVPGP